MYTIIKEVFQMKALYINDCQYNFIDNQGNLVFSFQSPLHQPITLLVIRKLQLASMIKGEWCESLEEISNQLSSLHSLNSSEIGEIVNFFELFNCNSKNLVDTLPIKIVEMLSSIPTKSINSDKFCLFLIESFEKNEILSHSIKEYHSCWRALERHNIYTVADLITWSASDLKRLIRNIGDKTIADLEAFLAENGLHLKEE